MHPSPLGCTAQELLKEEEADRRLGELHLNSVMALRNLAHNTMTHKALMQASVVQPMAGLMNEGTKVRAGA